MTAVTHDIVIEKGAKFEKHFVFKQTEENGGAPIDLTGKEGRMHIRIEVEDATPQLVLGSAEITVGGVNGTIDILVGATVTDTLDMEDGVYDLEIYSTTDPDDVIRLVEGKVKVIPNVTR